MRNFAYATVEKLWAGETAVLIASGPSLTVDDCDFVRGKARVIAVNSSYQRAPWADCLYACDSRWWNWHKGVPSFIGLKFALQQRAAKWPGVQVLRRGSNGGLSVNPSVLNLGHNSGYQALNLAVLFGATRIVLLGYDMQPGPNKQMHWHPEHPVKTLNHFELFRRRFDTLDAPLRELGIEVVNCTRSTALQAFPWCPLRQCFT